MDELDLETGRFDFHFSPVGKANEIRFSVEFNFGVEFSDELLESQFSTFSRRSKVVSGWPGGWVVKFRDNSDIAFSDPELELNFGSL